MSAFAIRMLAILCMLIDHVGFLVLSSASPWYLPCRAVGRLAFPLFAFLIANGYRHTRQPWMYALRLFTLALVSEPIFDFAFSGKWWDLSSQNIFFTLALGLLGLLLFDLCRRRLPNGTLFGLCACIVAVLAADLLHADYGAVGVGLILCFYFTWQHPLWRTVLIALFALRGILNYYARFLGKYVFFLRPFISSPPNSPLPSQWTLITLCAALAAVPLLFYNGKKGPSLRSAWANHLIQASFYLFYPLHLFFLSLM